MPDPKDPPKRRSTGRAAGTPEPPAAQARPVAVGRSDAEDLATPYAAAPPGEAPADTPAAGFEEAFQAAAESVRPAGESPPAVERPGTELLVGAIALIMSASVFLPWYSTGSLHMSGWKSGTWGPVIFFLGLAVAAIVGLRRAGVEVAFPVGASTVIEGIGWLCTLFVFAKRLLPYRPGGFAVSSEKWLTLAPLAAGVALAMLAGRLSSESPFLIRPGWFDGRPGKLGTAILAIAIAAGATFGLVNEASLGVARGSGPQFKTEPGMPACGRAARFPVPAKFRATQGSSIAGANGSCLIYMTSTLSLKAAGSAVAAAFKSAHWKVKKAPVIAGTGFVSFQLLGPSCGNMTLRTNAQAHRVDATTFITNCAALSPRPASR